MKRFPFQLKPTTDDERFMLEALKEAYLAFEAEEVPVGAVLVKEGKVIARGHNQVELLKDATAHAEMLCLTSGENAVENWRLTGTTLYSTLEPCVMCAGAMLLTRIDALVYGAPDLRHGACGSWVNLFDKKHPTHELQIRTGVYAEESAALLKTFFAKRRVDAHGVSPREEHFRGTGFGDLGGVNSQRAINDDQGAEAGPIKCSTRGLDPGEHLQKRASVDN